SPLAALMLARSVRWPCFTDLMRRLISSIPARCESILVAASPSMVIGPLSRLSCGFVQVVLVAPRANGPPPQALDRLPELTGRFRSAWGDDAGRDAVKSKFIGAGLSEGQLQEWRDGDHPTIAKERGVPPCTASKLIRSTID